MVREVAAGEHRVEVVVDGCARELVEHREVVLTVGVDGEDEVVGVELAALEPLAQVSEGQEVRLGHALVHVVTEQAAMRMAGQPRLDRGPGAVGRAVVDDDELVDERRELVQHRRDGRFLVVRRDDRDAAVRAAGSRRGSPRWRRRAPLRPVPLERLGQPFGERRARFPTELVARAIAAHPRAS